MVEQIGANLDDASHTYSRLCSEWRFLNRARRPLVLFLLIFSFCLRYAIGESAVSHSFQTAASILALDAEQAGHAYPAVIRGVVTCSTDFGLYVQDRTAGIWVDWMHAGAVAVGDKVEVRGHTGPGLFSPVVSADSVLKLGRAPLPRAKEVALKQLLTGDEDAQYVSVTGVVRSVSLHPNASPSQRVWLRVAMVDGFIFVTLPENDTSAARRLLGAEVRIDATATCTKNLNRQFTSVLLAAPSIHNVTVIWPPPKNMFAEPLTAIGSLMQYRSGTDRGDRVRVTGTVTYYRPGERLIIQEGMRALLVLTAQIGDIKLGDQVDAVGYPAPAPSGPYLEDAIVRYIGQGHSPKPEPVTIADLSSGRLNYNLVSIEGKLLQRIRVPNGQVLLLQNGSTLLQADLDDVKKVDPLKRIREGSIVRIFGISTLEVQGSWNWGGPTASAVHFTILLRSPNDVKEITPPSWWTAAHLFYLAAVLGILMFVFFALALYSRMEHVKLEAILQERERLAHDIHDTLAQSFAGIGFQLQAIRRVIPAELSDVRKQLDVARALVRHSHKEARRSVEPMHEASLENVDLLSRLEASARKMVEGGSVEVSAESSGQLLHPLSGRTLDALLHIGQEAIANAVRHAEPSQLVIALAYERDCVRLTVKDNGSGFEERGDLLGFGLRGMRRRSAAISAKLEIVSSPGAGTQVQITCPIQPSFTLALLFIRTWKFLSEIRPHGTRASSPNSDSDCG
jgi:signal transduction histidine kinase